MQHFTFQAILDFVFPRQKRCPISWGTGKLEHQGLIPAGLPTAPSHDLSQHRLQPNWLQREYTDWLGVSCHGDHSPPPFSFGQSLPPLFAQTHTHKSQFWKASMKQHAFSSRFFKHSSHPPWFPSASPKKGTQISNWLLQLENDNNARSVDDMISTVLSTAKGCKDKFAWELCNKRKAS